MYGNDKRGGFRRTNSICPTSEEILLKSVLKNERRHIERLLDNNPNLLNHIYGSEYNKPILLIACSEEKVEAATVKTLINKGANLHYKSELDEDWQAIHFAAYSTKSDTLRVVVEEMKEFTGDINALAKNSNALHVLIRFGKNENMEEFVKCAKILVQNGIDVNQGDRDNISPILWAAKKGFKEIIEVILDYSEDIPVDLDSHQSRKETARDIILRKELYDGVLPEKIDIFNESDVNILFKYLKTRNEEAFLNFKDGDIFDLVNSDDGCSTLLQIGCEKRLKRAVEHLINKGADPNLTINKKTKVPILIAAENGSYEIFEILLDHPKTHVSETVLITLLKNLDNRTLPQISHEECCNILLRKLEENRDLMDVNKVDESGNSPLHYAVRYSEPEKVEKLLLLDASLGSKNEYDAMPIQDMAPEILERHLDNCVEFDKTEKNFEKVDFSVTFNYTTLIPPTKAGDFSSLSLDNSDPETNTNHNTLQKFVAETEVISYMSKAPEFRHLLKHPVIVSFLFVKWHRIRWLFYTNLFFYIAFFLSMLVYIFVSYANFHMSENTSFKNFLTNVSFVIFSVTYIILIFRELFQIVVSPDKYFKQFENYIEIILIFFAGSILLIPDPANDTKKILSSVSILLAAFELVLMVGQHPKLSTNVVMLERVSLNFFKFLMWYSLLIIAFALSFYILFTETEADKSNSTVTENEDGEEDFFTDPGKSVFKTIVMLTGEFDAGSLNFHQFPVLSMLLFSLFIFMIAIILLNLLNGLAVNDTQQIKNNAELVGHIARAQHIQYVESMLLGNILPSSFLRKIKNFCCCFPEVNSHFKFSQPLAERACLFPQSVNYRLTVYPNNSGLICLDGKRSFFRKLCLKSCTNLYLDKETVKRTKRIIQGKREALKVRNKSNHIQSIENLVENLVKDAMNKRENDIASLNKKLDDIIRYISVQNNQ